MGWLENMFGTNKPVIGMVHFPALPGSPRYLAGSGLSHIEQRVRQDLFALQEGGIDAVLFSNEDDRPYLTRYGSEVVGVMAFVIGRLLPEIHVPYGVDVLWDPISTIALAKSTGAQFVREVFTGVYGGDMGFWNTSAGEALRYRNMIDASHIKLFFNLSAELAAPLATRSVAETARSIVFSSLPDVLCVSGAGAGVPVNKSHLTAAKNAVEVPVFVNTGFRVENAIDLLAIADGAIVGTSLKVGGHIWNPVDTTRVRALMKAVHTARIS
jgi:membrane complex biogenesis BtpA family protein